MTPEEFDSKMGRIYKDILPSLPRGWDKEVDTHQAADVLMCEFLREVGCGAGVQMFEDASKWYE